MHKSILLPITQTAAYKPKKVFCRNSSLVTSTHNKLTINDLKCDELRF